MKKFSGVSDCAYINNNYYVLKNGNAIEVCDEDLNSFQNFGVDIKYASITGDGEGSFYLCSENDNFLYKSNDFKTFEKIKLNLSFKCSEKIVNISYCKCFKSFLITTNKRVIMFNLHKKCFKVLYEVKEVFVEINDCMNPLGYDACASVTLISAVCCCKEIYVAYRIGNVSYISKLVNKNLSCIVYQTCDCIISMFVMCDKLWIMVARGCFQELIYTGIDCECCCNHDCQEHCECHVIESIALIEKSLAKILHSESLKIKAAIDKSDDIKDLICVNSSVSEMIYYITILEFILSEKLKRVTDKDECDC